MRRWLLLVPLAATGCPPPTHYLIADVAVRGAPVADALVAAACGGEGDDPALRTDPAGRARLELRRRVDASACSVTVAKPGLPTVEVWGVSICTTPACPATHVELDPPAEPPLARPLPYAQPPRRREVAR